MTWLSGLFALLLALLARSAGVWLLWNIIVKSVLPPATHMTFWQAIVTVVLVALTSTTVNLKDRRS